MKAQQIEGDLWDFGTVAASSGNDRLCLRYIGEDRFDFHELVWERKVNDQWIRHKTITAQAFCRCGELWIIALHSFDAEQGKAIVCVGASGGTPDKGLVGYSWRSLDLINRVEPVVLQKCSGPHEAYTS